ncbi:MAG: cadherin-like beta sandwich domain-containing protein [Oscillospiraceae bacterium]|nr:cadherin-like beta sandwich domain-containing protein [Oscillospiraceae bacterium]
MKKSRKLLCLIISLLVILSTLGPAVYAKEFAPEIDVTNFDVRTQYKYDVKDPSWVRKVVIKEDMLSVSGLTNTMTLHPVSSYPYKIDAKSFKAQVEEYIELYTLDEDSTRAAYIYLLEQIGALGILADPDATNESQVEWLRSQGIVITKAEENDPDKVIMISALYAFMKNDFYYVITGERLEIPAGTTLEEAVVLYLSALSGNNSALTDFIKKYFEITSIATLDDYIYYSSLLTLFTSGYISASEVRTLSRQEVYRRMAIMTISKCGISISKNASKEEITEKYLTAMLGKQYKVSIDSTYLKRAMSNNSVPFYILQRMAYEDATLTLSQNKYTYEECFKTVCQKTNRFNLKNEWYADVHEYNVYLDHIRENISINVSPLFKGTTLKINGKNASTDSYALVQLNGDKKQVVTIETTKTENGKTYKSAYNINVYQGKKESPDSELTGIIGNITVNNNGGNGSGSSSGASNPAVAPVLTQVNGALLNVIDKTLTLNEDGKLVDANGNIVSGETYEPLPEGYKYALDEDGLVTIISDNTAETTTGESGDSDTDKIKKIAITASVITIVALAIAFVIIIIYYKNKKTNKKPKTQITKKRTKKEK